MTYKFHPMKVSQFAGNMWLPYWSNHADMTMWPQIIEQIQSDIAIDAQRSWTGNTQQFTLTFGEPMTGSVSGYSVTVNGGAQSLTYVSGSGTATWVFQIGALLHNGDVIVMTYSPGTTVALASGVALLAQTNGITNSLTKRVRFILCDSLDAPVANEAVKSAVMEYDSGVVANTNWMLRANKETVTTAADGAFDALYTGTAAVGGTVYSAVIRTTETMLVAATVS